MAMRIISHVASVKNSYGFPRRKNTSGKIVVAESNVNMKIYKINSLESKEVVEFVFNTFPLFK